MLKWLLRLDGQAFELVLVPILEAGGGGFGKIGGRRVQIGGRVGIRGGLGGIRGGRRVGLGGGGGEGCLGRAGEGGEREGGVFVVGVVDAVGVFEAFEVGVGDDDGGREGEMREEEEGE